MLTYVAAATIVLATSIKLGLLVLVLVAGLRILGGIGGEEAFGSNFDRQFQRVGFARIQVGTWRAGVDALD